MSLYLQKGSIMGAVKAWAMDCEERVYDVITETMVSECQTINEFYSIVDNQLPDFIPGDIITSVCDDAWNEYYMAKV
jgi:hypothetical protein